MSNSITSTENLEVLERAKGWFKEKIIKGHIIRTEELVDPNKFQINPFITPYLSAFLTGDVTAEGIARSLVYARVLGTSISTSFGQNLQSFISDVLVNAFGSIVSGIDIKFTDKRSKPWPPDDHWDNNTWMLGVLNDDTEDITEAYKSMCKEGVADFKRFLRALKDKGWFN
jgi:hypothetical protein